MKKNGFTLIELLAVIVILAIIALIATPIILGIINDARKESNERSVEMYASAVKNAIASYQLTHPNAPASFDDLDVQYDGNVVCATEELYSDGSFYIADCTVNGTAVDYTYGAQQVTQVYKPQYYSWASSVSIGEDLPSDAKKEASEIDTNGYPFYLGFDVDANNKITTPYVCFFRNNTEYCLKASAAEAFDINTNILKEAFADVADIEVCQSFESSFECEVTSEALYVGVYEDGDIIASDDSAIYTFCMVEGTVYDCQTEL